MPCEGEDALAEYGCRVIRVPGADYLAPPVSSHPDMIFLPLGDKLFCHRLYLSTDVGRSTTETAASLGGKTIVPIDDETGAEYPLDVPLNCAVIGNILLASPHTSLAVTEYAEGIGMVICRVKQGYVKCSSAVINGDGQGVITSDSGIAHTAEKNGIKVLIVPPGDIILPGYDYGFIGGCTGYDGGKMFFTGDLSLYPHEKEVKAFLGGFGCEAVSLLPGRPLTDYGSILFL